MTTGNYTICKNCKREIVNHSNLFDASEFWEHVNGTEYCGVVENDPRMFLKAEPIHNHS